MYLETEPKNISRFILYAKIFSWFLILIGVSVQIGWLYNITLLKSIVPGIVSMNPLTAVCFIIAGSLVLKHIYFPNDPYLKTSVRIGGIFIFTVGFIRTLGIVFGIDWHIDHILFHDTITSVKAFSFNRVAPNTALNMMLIGTSFFLLAKTNKPKIYQTLAFITAAISLFAITGYVYHVTNLYGFLSLTPMALNTAAAFFMTTLAILFSNPESGYMKIISANTAGGVVTRKLVPAIILFPLIVGFIRLKGQQWGYYGTEYGASLYVMFTIIGFFILIFKTAKKLHELDLVRIANQVELKNAKAKDDAILSGIGDAVFAIDNQRKIILFNRAASLISGIKEAAAIGKDYRKILPFADEKTGTERTNFIDQALVGHKAHMSNHTVLTTKTGKVIPVADSASPIVDTIGKVQGVVVVFRDVTKEKEVERAKDEFISLASHQLRTPLTVIRLYSEMLADPANGKLSKEQKESIDIVQESTVRMIRLVGDILNVSRIQLGSLKVDPQPTDLADIIKQLNEEVKLVLIDKKLELEFIKADTELPKVNVDQELIRQVIHNLLTNAIRYSSPGSKITITLGLTKKGQSPSGYLVSVKDTGIGIPKEVQARIFERFFRAENAVKKVGEGTGLGLYMAKMVMDLAGGQIWFESTVGKGTIFNIIIPKSGMIKSTGTKSLS